MTFDQPDLLAHLDALDATALDTLPFGVIHFNQQLIIQRYNRYEQDHTGLRPENVIGRHVFTEIAQCMNNFLVAQRIEDALEGGHRLDDTIDYVLTWKMRPKPVRLRMLTSAEPRAGYVLLLLNS